MSSSASTHNFSEAGIDLPELPHISSQELIKRLFTHKSYLGTIRQQARDEEPENNERLAFLGSHILPHIVASKLYDRIPRYSKGDLTVSCVDLQGSA